MKPTIPVFLMLTAALAASSALASEAADAQAPVAPSALIVVRDAETGMLRAPTAAEVSALQPKQRARATAGRQSAQPGRLGNAPKSGALQSPVRPTVRAFASGARSSKMPAELASYSVAIRQPDGSLRTTCIDGEHAAVEAIQSASPVLARQAVTGESQ